MKKISTLFWTFLKIGAFTFGGGYAMVALLEHEFVEEKQWVTREEFLDMVAIAESTPGPMAVNSATYIGYKLEGVPGAAASTLAVCLPSFAVIYAISLFFDQFLQLSVVSSAFRGIQVCVVYLVLSAGLKMLKNLKKDAFSRAVLAAVLLAMVSCSVLAVSFSSIFYILLIVSQYKGAIALFSTLFGMDKTVIIVAFSLFAIILVNIGGFKSVAWTDFLQGILMVIIAVVIFIAAFKAVGWSFADVNTQLSAIDPNLVQPFNESGLYSLSGVIAMPFYLFVSLVANPYCTIRLMAMTDVGRKSFKKFGLTLISVGMICMLMYMSGLFGRVLYPNLADADSVIPTIAQNLLPEWGLAIVAVGLFASMMACVDSMIHCISAMLSVDIYKRTLKKDATDQQVAKAARYITFAVVAIVLIVVVVSKKKK